MTFSESMKCCFCSEKVIGTENAAQEVVGWFRFRRKGLNALSQQKRTGRVAHASCLELAKAGQMTQGALL